MVLTKNLYPRDGAAKEKNARADQEDILTVSKVMVISRFTLNTPARVRTRPPAAPMRNTAATFKAKAVRAFEIIIRGPIRKASRKGANPSVNGMKHALMMEQTYLMSSSTNLT